jgi:large subunit ribosomal protein L23
MAKKESQKNVDVVASTLIISPMITEKASVQSSANAYTFKVTLNATKLTIAKEFEKTYKVKPLAISKLPGKSKLIRGRVGHTSPTKKAIIFLKKGDTITLA